MHDAVAETLQTISESCHMIMSRFSGVSSPDEFLQSEKMQVLLDSIAMRLQIIGENVKSIGKLDPDFYARNPDINWKGMMRLRDNLTTTTLSIMRLFSMCARRESLNCWLTLAV